MARRLPGKRIEFIDIHLGQGNVRRKVEVRLKGDMFYCHYNGTTTPYVETKKQAILDIRQELESELDVTWGHYLDVRCKNKILSSNRTFYIEGAINIEATHVLCSKETLDSDYGAPLRLRATFRRCSQHVLGGDSYDQIVLKDFPYPAVPNPGIGDVRYIRWRPTGTLIPYSKKAEETLQKLADGINGLRDLMRDLFESESPDDITRAIEGMKMSSSMRLLESANEPEPGE